MTRMDRVKEAINNFNFDNDGVNELIAFAYYLGRHEAAKEVCDKAKEIFALQLDKASKSRYYKMAAEIQGNRKTIYHGDYDNSFVEMFAADETNIN